MPNFVESTLFRNMLGLMVLSLIWLFFSIFGLKGVSFDKSIKEIRQETGASLLTLAVFTLAVLALIAFFSTQSNLVSPLPF